MNTKKKNYRINESKLKNLLFKTDFPVGKTSDFDLFPKLKEKFTQLKPAAILIPILTNTYEPMVIFTRRAQNLSQHPGQISFPGGKVEKKDSSEAAAALRESKEEIGLKKSEVNIIGVLPKHETVTGFLITPFIGIVKTNASLKANPKEVSDIFEVPLRFLLEDSNLVIQKRNFKGIERAYYTIPYGPYYIWGATARIIKTLADRIRE